MMSGDVATTAATEPVSPSGATPCRATLSVNQLGLQSTATWTALTARFSYVAVDGAGGSDRKLKKTYLSRLILHPAGGTDDAEVIRVQLTAAFGADYQQFQASLTRR